MNRTEIEIKLNTDRSWLLERVTSLPAADLARGVTPSEHDPDTRWSAKDHLAHLSGIEKSFNRMIRRHLSGDPSPVGLGSTEGPLREETMRSLHAFTESWVLRHREASLNEVIALGQSVRAETLALLADLTDTQLVERLPGAPWADGTIGGVLGVNGDHARTHMRWVEEGFAQTVA